MTDDTYDTCFHKIFSRAHAGKTYIYFKKKIIKEKVIKTRCHICHVSHLSHESTHHKWTTHHLEPLIILNTHHLEYEIFLNTSFFWTRITRITRIIFCTWNYLREDAHGSHESHVSLFAAVRSHEERIAQIFLFRTRISQISRICLCFAWLTDIFFDLSFKT